MKLWELGSEAFRDSYRVLRVPRGTPSPPTTPREGKDSPSEARSSPCAGRAVDKQAVLASRT